MDKYYVGIDTSAYTTSLAAIDERSNIVLDLREILRVKRGQKGLRQQEAIFQHINNLPTLIERMTKELDVSKIQTISCSIKPRNMRESYMPVFIVGKGQAFVLSKILDVEYKEFSHQEGHISAGMLDNDIKDLKSFMSLHISGGTTELLMVHNQEKGFKIDIIGGSLDLSVGQLIDRIGVGVGINFPCGKAMDRISSTGNPLDLNVPINIKDSTWFNLSGMENYFKSFIKTNKYAIEDIFATLFYSIAFFIDKILSNSCIQYGMKNVLITGGVSANTIVRGYLETQLRKKDINIHFPRRELCTDNGVGIAYAGKLK